MLQTWECYNMRRKQVNIMYNTYLNAEKHVDIMHINVVV